MLDRRTLIQLTSAALLSSCTQKPQNAPNMKVVVVGAGIIGASIAYHLSKLGVQVTVIDKVGPATQTSLGTFAWINATWAKQPRSYHTLNQDGISSWKTLQNDLGIPVKWGGSIEWFDSNERQDKLAKQIAEQIAWGEPAAMLGVDDLVKKEPNVDFSGVSRAAFSGNDGAVDPVLATLTLLKAAQENGASLSFPCELTGVNASNGTLQSVETTQGTIPADKVILATGAAPNMASRFADIDLPQRSTPGVIAITKPMPPLLNRLVIAPGVHMHQRLDGRLVLGEQAGAPKTEAHKMRLKGRPISFPTPEYAQQHFMQIQNIAAQYLPGIDAAEVEAVHIGWRPLPLDGHPVLGFSPSRPNIYLAVMHSGVSLAPIIGQLAAQEITSEAPIDSLSTYRPDRTFQAIKRY